MLSFFFFFFVCYQISIKVSNFRLLILLQFLSFSFSFSFSFKTLLRYCIDPILFQLIILTINHIFLTNIFPIIFYLRLPTHVLIHLTFDIMVSIILNDKVLPLSLEIDNCGQNCYGSVTKHQYYPPVIFDKFNVLELITNFDISFPGSILYHMTKYFNYVNIFFIIDNTIKQV